MYVYSISNTYVFFLSYKLLKDLAKGIQYEANVTASTSVGEGESYPWPITFHYGETSTYAHLIQAICSSFKHVLNYVVLYFSCCICRSRCLGE